MAKEPVITDIASLADVITPINNNFDNIQTAFDNTLSRDGSSPNQMEADIDLNSNDLLNVRSLGVNGSITLNGVPLSVPTTPVSVSYNTRSAFVGAVAGGLSLDDGAVVSADGLLYKADSTSTAISDLPGWLPSDQWPVDARHFGAAFDGTTDDTAELQAGIDYVTGITGGGVLELPSGTTIVADAGTSTAITLKANVWLRGLGRSTVIKLANGQDSHVIGLSADTNGQAITDLTIDGNRANQSEVAGVHGIRLHGNDSPRLERLFITECRFYGIGVGYTAGTERPVTDGRFVDIEISNCGQPSNNAGDGFDAKRTERCLFQNIYIHGCEQRGLDARGAQNVYNNIWAYNNGATGISLRALGTVAEAISEENYIQATNCYAFNNAAEGFFIASNEPPLTGFKCEYDLVNCHAFGNGLGGFLHRGTEMLVRYTQCTAKENTGAGFRGDNTNSDATCVSKYTSCNSIGNTGQGFFVPSALGRHSFIQCAASGNGANDQVLVMNSDSEWSHGDVDASGHVRGLYCTGDRFTVMGGSFTSNGSNDGLRIDGDNFNVVGAVFHQSASLSCFRVVGTNGKVVACDFSDVTAGTPLNNATTTTTSVIGCKGITDPIQTQYSGDDVNNLTFHSSVSGAPVKIEATGSNSTVDIELAPKGSFGRVRFGAHSAIGSETVTGYIEIKDSSGTTRKVAIVS